MWPVVVSTDDGVEVLVTGGSLLFHGRNVTATLPWPLLADVVLAVLDELLDAGVAMDHPFLRSCLECDAGFAEPCMHLRTGDKVHGWHKERWA